MSTDDSTKKKKNGAGDLLLPVSTSDVTQEVRIVKGLGGPSKRGDAEPKTIMENFDKAVSKFGNKPALHQKRIHPVRWCFRHCLLLSFVVAGCARRSFYGWMTAGMLVSAATGHSCLSSCSCTSTGARIVLLNC